MIALTPDLRGQLARNLAQHTRCEHALDGRMTGVAGGAAFLLCRRAAKISAHAGQWALPGGRRAVGLCVAATTADPKLWNRAHSLTGKPS